MIADAKNKITVDGDELIEALGTKDPAAILELLKIDLLSHICETRHDHNATCEWREDSENKWWRISAYQLDLTDSYAIRWTYADDVGAENPLIYERVDPEDDRSTLAGWLHEIASAGGTQVRASG